MNHETLTPAPDTLRDIADAMKSIAHRIEMGDYEHLDDLIADIDAIDDEQVLFEDKLDAIVHICESRQSRLERLKREKARITDEIKRVENEDKRLKEYAAFQMQKAEQPKVKTRLHRLTSVQNPFSAEYDENDKEFDTIDERCIVEVVSRKVSKSVALEIFKTTGKAPRGFTIERKGYSLRIK